MVRTRVLGWAAGLPDPFWKSVTFSRGHWRGGGWPLFWVPIPLPASRSPLGFCCPEGRGSGETPTVEMGGPGLGLGQGFWAKRGWGSGGLRERDRIDPSGPPWGCPAPSPPLATPQSSLGAPGAGRGRYPREDPLPRGGGGGCHRLRGENHRPGFLQPSSASAGHECWGQTSPFILLLSPQPRSPTRAPSRRGRWGARRGLAK